MNKVSRWVTAGVTLAAVLAGSQAFAGQKWGPSQVLLYDQYAQGDLTDARNSSDALQFIGCSVGASAAQTYVSCAAENAAGVTRSCYAANSPALAAIAGTIEPGTYMHFYWDASGTCTMIEAAHFSGYTPR
jgi:hypothetical protein